MSTVIQEIKRQKILIFVLLAVLIISEMVLWFGFFRPSPQIGKIELRQPIGQIEKVKEIDLSVFESPFLKELQLFEEIKPFEGEIGRENPFTSY